MTRTLPRQTYYFEALDSSWRQSAKKTLENVTTWSVTTRSACEPPSHFRAMSSRPRSTEPQSASVTANGRASAASPNPPLEDVELKNVSHEDTKLPLPIEEDLLQLSRLGEIGAIQKLFDSGKFKATYKDEEGITALHVCCLELRGGLADLRNTLEERH